MSAPATDDRFGLIELDLPSERTARPARPAPTPTPAPQAMTELESARALLLGSHDARALNDSTAELVRRYPDTNHPIRVALRPVYRALATALCWMRMWASFSRAVSERPGLVMRFAVAAVTPLAPYAEPHRGGWARVEGRWQGFVRHTGRAVRPGDHVLLETRDGSRSELRAVVAVLSSDYRRAGAAGCLVSVTDTAPATARQPIPVVQSVPEPVAPEQTTAMASTRSLVEALGNVSTEGAANAATHASGSLAQGTMAGVGFTSAQGYVQALANGVKRATADGYLATLQGRYHYTSAQITALTVTIIPEGNALPVSPGIVHEATGPDIFTQRREERRQAAQQVRAQADAATVAFAQSVMTTAADQGAWWEIGWDGHGSITRGEVLAACGIAPEAKAAETQLGRTCDSLRGTHDCAAVTPPPGVRRRWQIGRGRQHAAYVGAGYGQVLAIVDLMPNGELHWEGDESICGEVRAKYDELTSQEVLRAGDITSWLSQVLRYRFGARRNAHNYLVPPERREQARELCNKLASVWARGSWLYGRIDPTSGEAEIGKYVTDVATILGGLLMAVTDEVSDAEKAWQVVVDAAGGKGNKVGARAAANALLRHDGERPGEGILARVDSLQILGQGPLSALRARCAALRSKILAAVDAASDSGSVRSAMLELE